MDKLSYAMGLGIGQQLSNMGATELVIDDFAQAIKDVLAGSDLAVSHLEGQKIVQEYFRRKEEEMSKDAREAGEAFLAENGMKEGVTTTASGLQYQVLKEGTGAHPKATDSVTCHYEGRLIDGKIFDSSYKRGEPATFGLQQVIAGWTEGLQLMREGAKYRFFIPYILGYGASGAGQSIPPYATLIFDVELINVV